MSARTTFALALAGALLAACTAIAPPVEPTAIPPALGPQPTVEAAARPALQQSDDEIKAGIQQSLDLLARDRNRRRHPHRAIGQRGPRRGARNGTEGAPLLRVRRDDGERERQAEQGALHGPVRKQVMLQVPPPPLTMLAEKLLPLVRVMVARWFDWPK